MNGPDYRGMLRLEKEENQRLRAAVHELRAANKELRRALSAAKALKEALERIANPENQYARRREVADDPFSDVSGDYLEGFDHGQDTAAFIARAALDDSRETT